MPSSSSIAPLLLLLASTPASTTASREAVSPAQFSKFWSDPAKIIDNLENYQALWIKVHGCVWSECAVDDNDDDGENRDGDENWYQQRTQQFCANVAYSLYGIPKNHVNVVTRRCGRANYIDSFFTYGGADTLLFALNKNPYSYYDGKIDNEHNDNNNNDDDYYGPTSMNSKCYIVGDDDTYPYTNSEYYDGNHRELIRDVMLKDLKDEADEEFLELMEERELDRDLSSADDDSMYTSSTLGCSADGKFAVAQFQGQTCDGKYFTGTVDEVDKYNHQHKGIHCQKIWGRAIWSNSDVDSSAAKMLLESSWSCDLDLYPNGCPDPYGVKQRYSNALRAVAHGQSPGLAIFNGRVKRPMHVFTVLFFIFGIFGLCFGYYLRNKERMATNGGGVRGLIRVMREDYVARRLRIIEQREQRRKERDMYSEEDEESDEVMKSRSAMDDDGTTSKVSATRSGRSKSPNKKKKKKKKKGSRSPSKKRRSASKKKRRSKSRNREEDKEGEDQSNFEMPSVSYTSSYSADYDAEYAESSGYGRMS